MTNTVQFRLWNRVATEVVVSISDIDEVDVSLRSHSDQIGLLGVPFDSVERVQIVGRKDTQYHLSAIIEVSDTFS